MKNFMIIAICIAVFVGLFVHVRNQEAVTKAEFKEQIDSLKAEHADLKANQDSIKMNIDSLKMNMDSLKAGQKVIYDAVTNQPAQPQEKGLIQMIIEKWKN